jgi:uncharacterized protein with PQ loop repeat
VELNLPVLAGTISTIIFLVGTFPMLHKAIRTRDLRSYSKGMLLLNNIGNVVHAVYIYSLPVGPIWALHTFYLVATALMLIWYLRYEEKPARHQRQEPPASMASATSLAPAA